VIEENTRSGKTLGAYSVSEHLPSGGHIIIGHFAQEVYHVDFFSILDINFHFVCILSMSMVKFTAIE